MRYVFSTSVLLVMCVLVSGCQSDPARDRAKKAIAGLRDTREALSRATTDVSDIQATLTAMVQGTGDQQELYKTYKSQLATIEKNAANGAEAAADMSERYNTYREAWQQEASQISDGQLRSAAQSRSAAVKEKFDDILTKFKAAKEAYQPFVTKLRDVQSFLGNDLTPAGSKAATPAMQSAISLGNELKAKVQDVVTALDSVSAHLSPGARPAN